MMTTEIREKFYGRFVQNAPLTRGDIELPVAMHDVREVSALSIFIFFLYDNYCILFSVFLLLVLFIFSAPSPLAYVWPSSLASRLPSHSWKNAKK